MAEGTGSGDGCREGLSGGAVECQSASRDDGGAGAGVVAKERENAGALFGERPVTGQGRLPVDVERAGVDGAAAGVDGGGGGGAGRG